MKNDIAFLIAETMIKDKIGQQISVESEREVFCSVKSVGQKEFFEGGRNGLKPSLLIIVDFDDYQDEKIVLYNEKKYSVYRTYTTERKDIELYIQEKVGV